LSTTIRITYVRLADRYRIDEVVGDGVVLEWERCPHCQKRASLKARIAGRCLDHDVPDQVLRPRRGAGRAA
jgi:hypothetical protein